MWDYNTVFGVDLYHIIQWFLFYSILGWGVESAYMSVCNHKLTNRGFARMPMCPIYGIGALTVYFILKPFSNSYVLLYILGVIIPTVLEYATAKVMIRIFGEVWWDYSDKPFNYKGIICLESSIVWGFYTLFLFAFLQNAAVLLVENIPKRIGHLFGGIILFGYIIDFSICFYREKSPDESFKERMRRVRQKIKNRW